MLSLPSSAQFLRASLLLTFVTIASCGTILALNAQDEDARPFFVEGYAGKVSYAPGEGLELHVSTSAKQFSIEVARVGATRQTVFQKNGIPGMESPIPENASSHGCQWPMAFHMPIPSDWKSGYYEVKLKIADDGGKYAYRGKRTAESSCYFVLRASKPGASSPILMQLATNTYNAYNNWGGFSLYAFNGRAGVQGNRVSFHRPPQSQYSRWEQAFCSWAESQGYVLEYAANSDLEFHPEILAGYQLVLSVGHDEYWSAPMRDHLEAFIASGKNVAFFSGNTCCWQVRSEDQGNALVSWKQRYVMDPIYPSKDHRLLSTLWSHHLVARPENQLTGVGFLFGGTIEAMVNSWMGAEPTRYIVPTIGYWMARNSRRTIVSAVKIRSSDTNAMDVRSNGRMASRSRPIEMERRKDFKSLRQLLRNGIPMMLTFTIVLNKVVSVQPL